MSNAHSTPASHTTILTDDSEPPVHQIVSFLDPQGHVDDGHQQSLQEENPPDYDSRGRLVRTVPIKITRYDVHRRAEVTYRTIAPGPVDPNTNDRPPPPGWHKLVHPEGQLYFYHPAFRAVTEAYMHEQVIHLKINFYLERVRQLASAQTIVLPQSSELYLELDDENNSCKYYLLDHATRGLFWLDGGSLADLELPPVSSDDHLKILMEEQYWNHVEFFPNHIKLSPGVEFEIRGMLTHSAADIFTSDQSTAPYTMEQCQNFLTLINNLPTTPETNSYKNCVIARLMAEFASNRFVHHAGERSARLSRAQSLLDEPAINTPFVMRFLIMLCFYLPKAHEVQLDSLYVDQITFSAHWRKFVQERVADWRAQVYWGFALALLDALLLLITIGLHGESDLMTAATAICRGFGFMAEILSLGSVFTALALTNRHSSLIESHAMDASTYLGNARDKGRGFQGLAIVYSMPAALLQWSFVFTTADIFVIPWNLGSPMTAILVMVFFVLVLASAIVRFSVVADQKRQLPTYWTRLGTGLTVAMGSGAACV